MSAREPDVKTRFKSLSRIKMEISILKYNLLEKFGQIKTTIIAQTDETPGKTTHGIRNKTTSNKIVSELESANRVQMP